MKFKGIELKDNTEAELLIAIEIVNISDEDELDEYSEELEETLYDKVFDYDNCDVYTEFLDDNLLNVRCDDITFDKKGVELITTIYKDIIEANLDNINVMIGVHIDGGKWFKREDGSEYNEDVVTLEEFLSNIEY
ncbi:hypothetical protein DW172_03100 [Agathobacter rectalis]|uniref:Uncharacterized protein n=1 Tax=Agathobacter rectalis TaxID=39491 RepID=A0A414ZR26_9FIRM|nr:hypothetical protein [Agathobacter rectalis]RHI25685.1 hypothetical protein DW172_03100 [Agathobacter rectalis]